MQKLAIYSIIFIALSTIPLAIWAAFYFDNGNYFFIMVPAIILFLAG